MDDKRFAAVLEQVKAKLEPEGYIIESIFENILIEKARPKPKFYGEVALIATVSPNDVTKKFDIVFDHEHDEFVTKVIGEIQY